jgi:hypothetical protein
MNSNNAFKQSSSTSAPAFRIARLTWRSGFYLQLKAFLNTLGHWRQKTMSALCLLFPDSEHIVNGSTRHKSANGSLD